MANWSISSVNLPPYNDYAPDDNRNRLRSKNIYISLKVCTTKDDQNSCIDIDIWSSSTLKQLKEKIACDLHIHLPLNKFFLKIFDEGQGQWKTIDNSDSSLPINELKICPSSTLSVEYYDQQVTKERHFVHSTSSTNKNHELKLKLCTKPMDRTYYSSLHIYSSSTLRELRKQVYEKFNKSSENNSIFVWNKDGWTKFESDMDDRTLANLSIESYAFISTDCDENNSSSKSPSGLCGIANLGSTCFMNSVFQCLSNIPDFTNKISSFNNEVNAPIIGEYIKLIKEIWSGKYKCIEPVSLIDNIKDHLPNYSSYRQQDAQEFMNHFLHLIHAELSTKETIITELFYGRIRSTVTCLECKKIEKTDESISFLPLPISNYNLRTILYIKADGEQRLMSIQVNSRVIDIGDLIGCFIKQHEPKLSTEQIQAIQLSNDRATKSYETWNFLRNVRDEELAFLERPKRSVNQRHISCDFFDHSTRRPFRPSIVLVCPYYDCRFSDLSEQIDQLLGHLCSMTDAPLSACHLYWKNRNEKQYELSIEASTDEDLPNVQSIMIEMDTEYVGIYKQHYNFNHATNNSGLENLLADFFREEPLDGDYHCLTCSKHTKARQKSDLYLPLPRVLIIQLKRFTYDIHSNDKIDTFISFPLDGLDLKEYIVKDDSKPGENTSPTKYDLVAVSNHTGSLSSGHYTAYAKNVQDRKWYSFDDKSVRELDSAADVVTKNAYILVYVQRN